MTSENDAGAVKPVIHRSPSPVKNVKEFLALLTHQNSVNYENTIIMYISYEGTESAHDWKIMPKSDQSINQP